MSTTGIPGCVGWVAQAPDYRVNWTAGSGELPLTFDVTADSDTVLVINDAEGNWVCNDDTDGVNPVVSFQGAVSGQYDVWVGTYSQGDLQPSTLHVTEVYGRESVCQIITFGTMASKAAIKDVGRALNMPYGDVERIAKLIPPPFRGRNTSISQAIERVPSVGGTKRCDVERVLALVDRFLRLDEVVSVERFAVGRPAVFSTRELLRHEQAALRLAAPERRVQAPVVSEETIERLTRDRADVLGAEQKAMVRAVASSSIATFGSRSGGHTGAPATTHTPANST